MRCPPALPLLPPSAILSESLRGRCALHDGLAVSARWWCGRVLFSPSAVGQIAVWRITARVDTYACQNRPMTQAPPAAEGPVATAAQCAGTLASPAWSWGGRTPRKSTCCPPPSCTTSCVRPELASGWPMRGRRQRLGSAQVGPRNLAPRAMVPGGCMCAAGPPPHSSAPAAPPRSGPCALC